MSEYVAPLTESDQDLMGQIARFAEKRASNGVYINQMVSKSLGHPVVLVFAIGEQALALTEILLKAQAPPTHSPIEIVKNLDSMKGF